MQILHAIYDRRGSNIRNALHSAKLFAQTDGCGSLICCLIKTKYGLVIISSLVKMIFLSFDAKMWKFHAKLYTAC